MPEFKSFYTEIKDRKSVSWCKYIKRLDTYGCGCQHDCSYCYSKSLLSFRGLWNAAEPSAAQISEIYHTIKSMPRYQVVKLGGMTDCFQPIELKRKITYETIKMLNRFKINYLIVTKSSLVVSDQYLKIYDKNLAHFQISITSTDNEKSKSYEKASLPIERIKAIEKLYNLGFDVSVRLSPFIEQNIDFKTINSIRCDKILIEFLKVNHWVKKWFDIDYSEYSLKYGGYEHLQLEKKIELVNKITGFNQISVGEYVREHHEYFSKNVNYNEFDCCNLTLKEVKKDKQLLLPM